MWKEVLQKINRNVENLTAFFLIVMVFFIFLQIVSRGLIGKSFPWTEEVSRYLMIWLTFLGASFAFQYGAHIGIEMMVMKMPPAAGRVVQSIAAMACSVFLLILIVKGIELIDKAMIQKSPALRLPMGYVYMVIPVSGVLMLLNLIDVTLKGLTNNQAAFKERN